MIILRSALLLVLMAVWTVPFAFLALASAPFAPMTRYRIIKRWADVVMWLLPRLCRIDYRVLGLENIPARPAVILSKHQSAWETIAFQRIFPPQAYVLKRELLRLPFFGWGLAQFPHVAIDRASGKEALAQVLEQGRARLEEGFSVVVFPEGTRTAPGATRRYKPGGAYLAAETGAPVLPVAHNAGEFWRRQAFLKYPGTVTVSIGPVIDPTGLGPEEVNQRAHAWIEAEMRRLFPHHYSGAAAPRPEAETA